MNATFDNWTGQRHLASIGTNFGSEPLPFQGWQHFKEAYAPELIERAVRESAVTVRRCLDPFGGSGTTSLACQFLGVHPVTVEVNPFLADLIEAKLSSYCADCLASDLSWILSEVDKRAKTTACPQGLPPTFVEPGVNGRWIFDKNVAGAVFAMLERITSLKTPAHRRFFKVLLGGILIDSSNVYVNGKGRRYRPSAKFGTQEGSLAINLFSVAARNAIAEVYRFSSRPCKSYDILRRDARCTPPSSLRCDLAVFSPPYPNSFDYTDIYNIELWTLGYLSDMSANSSLRRATLNSHVQIARAFPKPPTVSRLLSETISELESKRDKLWSRHIPGMVGAYFVDMLKVLNRIHKAIASEGQAWVVVGDSRYAKIRIPTAEILEQLVPERGWNVIAMEPFRSMRSSPQQGGGKELNETLIVLQKA